MTTSAEAQPTTAPGEIDPKRSPGPRGSGMGLELKAAEHSWGGLEVLAGIEVRFDDPAAFDSSIIVAVFGLIALSLRPQFRE